MIFDSRNVQYSKDYTGKLALADEPIRLRPANPNRGTLLLAQFNRYEDLKSGKFSYNRYDFEFQQYFPFYRALQVIAFRAFASISDPDQGANVPFYLMQTLGGSRALRGYGRFRFRDKNALLFNLEYRYKIWTHLEAGWFYELGNVYPEVDAMTFKNMKNSYGVSLRINTENFLVTRLDFAFADEGLHIILKWSNVF